MSLKVKLTAANRKLAADKAKEVLTVARDNERLFIEYISKSGHKPEVIIFDVTTDPVQCWHDCDAKNSGYARGCWHIALAEAVFGSKYTEVEIISRPNQNWAREDLTPAFFSRAGEFKVISLKPEGGEPPVEVVADSDLPEEAKFLGGYNLPKELTKKVLEFRSRQMARLTPEQMTRVPKGVVYHQQNKEVTYAVASLLYDCWQAPLFMGPAGSGKSTLAEALAEILHLPLRRISGGIDVNADYLLGGKTLSPIEAADNQLIAKVAAAAAVAGTPLSQEEFVVVKDKLNSSSMRIIHEPGVLLQAIANGEMILVDEVNMLIPEVTSLLHSLLDWQKTITISGLGEVKAHPDFRLVSAMNVGYMGTRPLNKAFRDRFRGIQLAAVSKDTVVRLLEQYVDNKIAQKLAGFYITLYEAAYSLTGATLSEDSISLRALLRAAEEYSMKIGSLQEVTVSCLTESIESEQERQQVKDLVEMKI